MSSKTKPEKRKQTRKPAAGKRRPLAAVWLTLGSMVFALLLGEIAIRVIYGPKFGPRPVFGVGDRFLGWKPATGLNDVFYGPDFEMHIRTDADGYRLGALGEPDYTRDIIVLLGDSYAFGWGLSTSDTFASQLDSLVNRESRGGVRIVNLGVGGYGDLQSTDRFLDFLRAHPDTHLQSVIVQHCINDGVDNYRSLGYHLGMWEIEQVEPQRHRLHLLNLVEYARKLSLQRKMTAPTQGESPTDGGDVLWSFRRLGERVTQPSHAEIGGVEINLSEKNARDDMSVEGPARKSSLSIAQREIMAGSMNVLHAECARRGLLVIHIFVATTPRWYVDEVSALATSSGAAQGCRVMVAGEIPKKTEFSGTIRNSHSGGHFNSDFSRFWAERMAGVLRQAGVF